MTHRQAAYALLFMSALSILIAIFSDDPTTYVVAAILAVTAAWQAHLSGRR